MKKRFSEEQIIGFLREAEAGLPIKELEGENAQLKRMLANGMLENEITKEALQKSGDRTGSTRTGAVHGGTWAQ